MGYLDTVPTESYRNEPEFTNSKPDQKGLKWRLIACWASSSAINGYENSASGAPVTDCFISAAKENCLKNQIVSTDNSTIGARYHYQWCGVGEGSSGRFATARATEIHGGE
jgi:hypothetical protein